MGVLLVSFIFFPSLIIRQLQSVHLLHSGAEASRPAPRRGFFLVRGGARSLGVHSDSEVLIDCCQMTRAVRQDELSLLICGHITCQSAQTVSQCYSVL